MNSSTPRWHSEHRIASSGGTIIDASQVHGKGRTWYGDRHPIVPVASPWRSSRTTRAARRTCLGDPRRSTGSCPYRDEPEVHIDAIFDSDHIAQQSSKPVHSIGRRLSEQPHSRPHREEALRDCGRLPAVALGAEVDLGRVDLDESDGHSVSKADGIAIDHPVNAIRRRSRCIRDERKGDDEQSDDARQCVPRC